MPIDYSKYPSNWKTEIRPRILGRANNCCEQCGVMDKAWVWYHPSSDLPEMQHVKTQNARQAVEWYGAGEASDHEPPAHGYLVVLTIAHIHDDNPMNCEDDNLMALCQTCHLRLDAKLHANNAKLAKLHKQENEAGQMRLF